MASTKKTFTTHKGIAVYPHLNRPDYQFNTDGVYTTKLRVPADQAKQLMDTLQALAQDEFGKKATSAKLPWKVDDDTGEIIFTAKSKFKSKFMDSAGKLISENNVPEIYGGSVLKLAGTLYPVCRWISRHHVAIGGMSNRHPGRPCRQLCVRSRGGWLCR